MTVKKNEEERRPRSVRPVEGGDPDFLAAVEQSAREIVVGPSSTWGEQIEEQIEELARLQVHLEDVRRPERREPSVVISAAAMDFRKKEHEVNEMMQKRLAQAIKDLRSAT